MSDPRYIKTGTPQTRVIEECSELIKILCKADRFGWYGFHPDDTEQIPNVELVLKEMMDVTKAMGDLADLISAVHPVDYRINAPMFDRVAPAPGGD